MLSLLVSLQLLGGLSRVAEHVLAELKVEAKIDKLDSQITIRLRELEDLSRAVKLPTCPAAVMTRYSYNEQIVTSRTRAAQHARSFDMWLRTNE